jgi:hypothetical protein
MMIDVEDGLQIQQSRKYIVSRKFDRRSVSQIGNRTSITATPINNNLYSKHASSPSNSNQN